MQVYKCDRCGAIFENADGHLLKSFPTPAEKDKELCNRCWEALNWWFNNVPRDVGAAP